jgi:UDP-perosamine 4-acetyltransferase
MTPPPPVLVVGAGGHALVCVEVLRLAGHTVMGCLARGGGESAPLSAVGVDVVGSDDALPARAAAGVAVFVAVGDNSSRQRLLAVARQAGAQIVTAVSPSAVVSPSARIEDGSLVMPGAVVNALARIGVGVIINSSAVVEHECRIGEFAHVSSASALAGNVTVGEGAFLGVGARVLPGRRVGAWATVGAGAVVVDDVPDGLTVVGVPARPLVRRA